jgi:hypothetical protein
MNIKKKLIILGCASLIFILLIFVFLYTSGSKNKPINTPNPSPGSQPSPTTSTSNLQSDLPDDTQFNQSLTDINKQYPWYSKLPIDTNKYHVVYDFTENKFKIRIKNSMTTSQIETTTQEALSNLRKIGVKTPIDYYVLDASGNQL